MSSVAPQKKSRVRETHQMAIEHYEKWLKRNPKAGRKAKIMKFDESVDLAARIREAKRQSDRS